ncbi:uncharacterized protein LOC112566615 isoform X1 [Pomacea canaliculata]|uniref:uncharacterized protein LOC112566615 isoform X1 n=1 Tax=Pomacea canaliculata TaxID=400727 RepID=UPI000D72FEF9|nr:uncharacterized protein LOC112566615 isoform X1 [Pomacea canaliculata]
MAERKTQAHRNVWHKLKQLCFRQLHSFVHTNTAETKDSISLLVLHAGTQNRRADGRLSSYCFGRNSECTAIKLLWRLPLKMFIFSILVASILLMYTQAQIQCGLEKGKRLDTFSEDTDRLKIPCKYNAVRQTCGRYFINVTPGNDIRSDTGEYYVDTMWVSVTDTETKQTWEGRTSTKIAQKAISDPARSPFNTKTNQLDINSICTTGTNEDTNQVYLIEKNGLFSISFGVYEEGGRKSKTSTWDFECNDSNVELVPYPEQACGNLTEDVVKNIRKDMDFSQDNEVYMYYVLNNKPIAQTSAICKSLEDIFANDRCGDREALAIHSCYKIVYSGPIYKKLLRFGTDPKTVWKACIDYVCSDFTDQVTCEYLGEALDEVKKPSDLIAKKIEENNCYAGYNPL